MAKKSILNLDSACPELAGEEGKGTVLFVPFKSVGSIGGGILKPREEPSPLFLLKTRGVIIMLAVNYSTIRKNFKEYCDKVTEDCETIIVTRKNEKNVVLLSLEEYNNIIENQFIMSNKTYYDRLTASAKQIEQGKLVTKTTEELEEMANE